MIPIFKSDYFKASESSKVPTKYTPCRMEFKHAKCIQPLALLRERDHRNQWYINSTDYFASNTPGCSKWQIERYVKWNKLGFESITPEFVCRSWEKPKKNGFIIRRFSTAKIQIRDKHYSTVELLQPEWQGKISHNASIRCGCISLKASNLFFNSKEFRVQSQHWLFLEYQLCNLWANLRCMMCSVVWL